MGYPPVREIAPIAYGNVACGVGVGKQAQPFVFLDAGDQSGEINHRPTCS